MAQQLIGVGTVANDNTGDLPRPAFIKVNDNFTENYNSISTLNGVQYKTVAVDIDDPVVGYVGSIEMPVSGTIVSWSILSDSNYSCVVDVKKTDYSTFDPPSTLGSSIAGSEKPTLSAAKKNQDLALSTWTTAVTTGDILSFYVESCDDVLAKLSIFIRVRLV